MKLTEEQKQANKNTRQLAKTEAKEQRRILSEKSQKPVKEIVFTIEWKRSQTWGYNPALEAEIRFKDGSYERSRIYRASGCGYDKESTVIAECFNEYLKYKLWAMPLESLKGGNGSLDSGKAPYGIHLYSESRPHFGGGIDTNCYYSIGQYIGGKFESVSSGKTFNVYKYTDNE